MARFVFTPEGPVDCATTACSFVFEAYSCSLFGCSFLSLLDRAETPISFRSGRGLGTTGPWCDGGSLRVAATDLDTRPGAVAFALQCAMVASGGFACGPTGTVEWGFDGQFDGTIVLEQNWSQGGHDVDCRLDACLVGVAVMGAGHEIFEGVGTYEEWGQFDLFGS